MESLLTRFAERLALNGSCLVWTGPVTNAGYGKFWMGRRTISVHRFAWKVAHGPIPNGLCVLHRCDARICVNPAHLFLGTHKDNTADCFRKGRRGDPMPYASMKLTPRKVRAIRRLHRGGMRSLDIAHRYAVSPQTLCNIVKGRRWGSA